MAISGAALQVQQPNINPVGHFNATQEQVSQQAMRKLAMAQQGLETIGSIALGVMGGKMDGQADPAQWDQAMEMLGAEGQKYKGRPDLAPVLAKASLGTLGQIQVAQNERELDMALQKFEAEMQAAAAKAGAPIEVSAGATMWDPQTKEPVYTAPGGTGTNVTVNTGEGSGGASIGQFQKDFGGIMAKDYGALRDDAKAARGALASLTLMEQAVNDPSFYSGIGNEQIMALKRLSAAVGIDPEGVSSMETFNALNKQAALDVMGGSLGTGFSNADRDFVIEQVPNLRNTPEGNRQLIAIQRKLAERKIEIAGKATDYVQEHGILDANFEDELAKWAEENPLFADGGEGEIVDWTDYF